MERSELKKHSTRNVILRMDYIPLMDDVVDKINNTFGEKYISEEYEFSQFSETFINNIDIQINDINDPTIQDSNNFLNIKNNSTRIRSYEYSKESNGDTYLKLIFNKYFVAIEILQDTKYCSFDDYKEIFISAITIIKNMMGESLRITRFGFRKLNDMFIKAETPISDFVNINYFNDSCDDLIDVETETLITEKRYTFGFEKYALNLLTHVSKGNLNEKLVKRLAFDIDLYSTESEFLKNIFEETSSKITEADDYIFKVFTNLLNNDFLNFYKEEKNEYDNLILGVMCNE